MRFRSSFVDAAPQPLVVIGFDVLLQTLWRHGPLFVADDILGGAEHTFRVCVRRRNGQVLASQHCNPWVFVLMPRPPRQNIRLTGAVRPRVRFDVGGRLERLVAQVLYASSSASNS